MTTPARAVALLQDGMTHADADRVVSRAWPDIRLELFRMTPAFYKEGAYAGDTRTDPASVLRVRPASAGRPGPPAAVLVTGSQSPDAREAAVEAAFGLWPQFYSLLGVYRVPHMTATLDEAQDEVWRVRAGFVARHGREPGPGDRLDDIRRAGDRGRQ